MWGSLPSAASLATSPTLGGDVVEQHVDARVGEAHHRTHAHARGDDGVRTRIGEQADGAQAAAFLVGRVLDDGDLFDLAVGDVDQGEAVAVAEVSGALGLQAAFAHRGNGELHRLCHGSSLSPPVAAVSLCRRTMRRTASPRGGSSVRCHRYVSITPIRSLLYVVNI